MRNGGKSKQFTRILPLWIYFLIGTVWAGVLAAIYIQTFHWNLTAVLGFGPNKHQAAIEADLGPLVIHYGGGHDGQLFYAIARDPLAQHSEIIEFASGACYRFRRILFPLLGGMGGTLDGTATLIGLLALVCLGLGLAVAFQKEIGAYFAVDHVATLFVLANPGVWFSIVFLTADTLALGLSLAGLAAWLKDRRCVGTLLFGASALTKEYYLLTPLALCVERLLRRDSRGVILLVIAAIPLLLWSLFLSAYFDCASAGSSVSRIIPFRGMLHSYPVWLEFTDPLHLVPTLLSLTVVCLGICGIIFERDWKLRLLLGAWVLLAISADSSVWDLGNNSARAFLPLWCFSGIFLVRFFGRKKLNDASE